MLSFSDAAALERAVAYSMEPAAAGLISRRLQLYKASGLLNLTHLLILEPGEDEHAIFDEIGFHPLINPLDGCHYGDPGFVPPWDWLSYAAGWFEMIITVGNDGFAYILLIEDDLGRESPLLQLCRECAFPKG